MEMCWGSKGIVNATIRNMYVIFFSNKKIHSSSVGWGEAMAETDDNADGELSDLRNW